MPTLGTCGIIIFTALLGRVELVSGVLQQIPSLAEASFFVGNQVNVYILFDGLNRATDKLKFVTSKDPATLTDAECVAEAAAGGTAEITQMGSITTFLNPNSLVFEVPGDYDICVKKGGAASYTALDSTIFGLTINGPSSFSPLTISLGTPTPITFTGVQLDRGNGRDSVKVVLGTASSCYAACSTAVCGSEVTDLGAGATGGPDDSGQTDATATITVNAAGD
jgi:hypothetical protein